MKKIMISESSFMRLFEAANDDYIETTVDVEFERDNGDIDYDDEVSVIVYYDYTPGEPSTYYHPGAQSSVDITDVKISDGDVERLGLTPSEVQRAEDMMMNSDVYIDSFEEDVMKELSDMASFAEEDYYEPDDF